VRRDLETYLTPPHSVQEPTSILVAVMRFFA